jgi:hypothetical protein
MSQFIRLLAPVGTTEFSHGTTLYLVRPDRTVDAPIEAVDALTRVGGFAYPKAVDPAVAGTATEVAAGKSPAEIAELISELERIEAEPAPTPITAPSLVGLTIPT